jgi:RimJ/RimL family protein N-acetyltransferase
MGNMKVLETERLVVRWLQVDDAPFVLELMNEPGWLRYIGNTKVKTLEQACDYIQNGPSKMIEELGFGLYLVTSKLDSTSMGICGLIKRDSLDHVDLGFAFLARFGGCGYAFEAAMAIMNYERKRFELQRLLAITTPDNARSIRMLEKLKFVYERKLPATETVSELLLFAHESGS